MNPESAFQEHVSGLLVPREHLRKRQVWTNDERKALDRGTRLLTKRGVALMLRCDNAACFAPQIERIESPDGGFILRCSCTDRIFQKAF